MNSLRALLPIERREILRTFEETGETDHPDYLTAMMAVYQRLLCRLDPWAEILADSMVNIGLPVYETVWGPDRLSARDYYSDLKCLWTLRCGLSVLLRDDASRNRRLSVGDLRTELPPFSPGRTGCALLAVAPVSGGHRGARGRGFGLT